MLLQATTEGPCLELPEVLQQYQASKSHFSRLRKDKSVQKVLISFRDFCTIMWLLHSRDKLSCNLRQREEYMNNVKYEDYVRVGILFVVKFIVKVVNYHAEWLLFVHKIVQGSHPTIVLILMSQSIVALWVIRLLSESLLGYLKVITMQILDTYL